MNDHYKNCIVKEEGEKKKIASKRFPELPQFSSTYPLPLPSGNGE